MLFKSENKKGKKERKDHEYAKYQLKLVSEYLALVGRDRR